MPFEIIIPIPNLSPLILLQHACTVNTFANQTHPLEITWSPQSPVSPPQPPPSTVLDCEWRSPHQAHSWHWSRHHHRYSRPWWPSLLDTHLRFDRASYRILRRSASWWCCRCLPCALWTWGSRLELSGRLSRLADCCWSRFRSDGARRRSGSGTGGVNVG